MGAACSPTGRQSSTPQASLHHLSSGQVSSSTRGRGHSTGARVAVQGDRLTGQAWLPGHLPSLRVGGSRPGPTIGWCRGEGVSPERQGQETVLILGTGDMKDPSLSSKSTWHILDPGSPCPPTPHMLHLGSQRHYSLLNSSLCTTNRRGPRRRGMAGTGTQPRTEERGPVPGSPA